MSNVYRPVYKNTKFETNKWSSFWEDEAGKIVDALRWHRRQRMPTPHVHDKSLLANKKYIYIHPIQLLNGWLDAELTTRCT